MPAITPTWSASTPAGAAHWVMGTGNEIRKTTYPTMAGENGLKPMPQYNCLARIIAVMLPTTTSHQGQYGGRAMTNRTPDTRAVQSSRQNITQRRHRFNTK